MRRIVPHTFLALTAVALLASAPAAARADTTPQQAIAYLNVQRQANGIPAVSEDDSLASWCPNEHQAPNGVAYVSSPTGYYDAWTATTNPWDTAPLHDWWLFDPQETSAGASTVDSTYCVGLTGEASFSGPTQFMYVGPAGPSAVPPIENVPNEEPFAPQQLVGIPQGANTGPNILLYVAGWGSGLKATNYSLTGPSGPVTVKMVDASQTWQGQGTPWTNGIGGVMIPVSPLASNASYSGQVSWTDSNGDQYNQPFTFTTTSCGESCAGTGGGDGGGDGCCSGGQPKHSRLRFGAIMVHGHRLIVHVHRARIARGSIELLVARINGHRRHYRQLAASSSATATFRIDLGRGRWSIEARFTGSGCKPALVTSRITVG